MAANSIKEAQKAEAAEAKKLFAMRQEHWLATFCMEEERKQLLTWLREEGLERPDGFDRRMERAEYLKKRCNDFFNEHDYRRALHLALGAVHHLDFTPGEQMEQTEDQRSQVAKAMMLVLSNMAMIFLNRGDFANAEKSASMGLRAVDKLPKEETAPARAKLLYRRGLARGEPGSSRDLEKAHEDLLDAAKLEPKNHEIRVSLERCKKLYRRERRQARGEPVSEDEPDDDADTAASAADEAAGGSWALCCRRRRLDKDA
jgi:hypothetical protein